VRDIIGEDGKQDWIGSSSSVGKASLARAPLTPASPCEHSVLTTPLPTGMKFGAPALSEVGVSTSTVRVPGGSRVLSKRSIRIF
jgi:hypothetical protein